MRKKNKQKNAKIKTYKDLLNLPSKVIDTLPNSYDMIGDLAIIKLPSKFVKYKNEIAIALLKSKKNIKTVYLANPVRGELRIRKLEFIAGDNKSTTLHTEFGLKYEVNIKKTYFSPRLANERKYISNLVKPGETLIDMFTGVAPFSIMIAKYSNPNIIYAIDKNPDSILFAKKNIVLNNVLDKIELIEGDAKKILKNLKNKSIKADRIIMNLPFSADKYLSNAFEVLSNQGVIHLYNIIDIDEMYNKREEIVRKGDKKKFKLVNIEFREIKSYSPREFYMGIDITAKKAPM